MKRKPQQIVMLLVGLWVVFTVTLAGWWLVFGLRQLERLKQVQLEGVGDFQNHYQMLIWEGGVLILFLIGGGVALFYYARREHKRHAQVEEFFTAFTHDAKTALASLRLQAESLREDWAEGEPNPLLERLLSDTVRLQLQLENSLFLVNLPNGRLLTEPVSLSHLIAVMRHHWPDLKITQSGDGVVLADVRAVESVLANLVQNAVIHGRATQVNVDVEEGRDGRLCLLVADNGHGFAGNFDQLGKLFVRHARNSGSGVGLYLARQLMKRMNGKLTFGRGQNGGFVAALDFPLARADQPLPQAVRGES
jgi:signal transduction histidine kinase